MKKFFKIFTDKLLKKTKQDFIPAKEIGELAHIALYPKSLLDFALIYKSATTFEPTFGNISDIKLVFIGLSYRVSDPAFMYCDQNKAFIVFVGDKRVYQVELKSVPYIKSCRSGDIKIYQTGQTSSIIEVSKKKRIRTTMEIKDYNSCNGFGRPHFLKTVKEL